MRASNLIDFSFMLKVTVFINKESQFSSQLSKLLNINNLLFFLSVSLAKDSSFLNYQSH